MSMSSGRSSINAVLKFPVANVSSSRTPCRNEMFVATPRILNSARALLALATAASKVRPLATSFTSKESKCGETSEPAETVPPSSRIPAPPGDR